MGCAASSRRSSCLGTTAPPRKLAIARHFSVGFPGGWLGCVATRIAATLASAYKLVPYRGCRVGWLESCFDAH